MFFDIIKVILRVKIPNHKNKPENAFGIWPEIKIVSYIYASDSKVSN